MRARNTRAAASEGAGLKRSGRSQRWLESDNRRPDALVQARPGTSTGPPVGRRGSAFQAGARTPQVKPRGAPAAGERPWGRLTTGGFCCPGDARRLPRPLSGRARPAPSPDARPSGGHSARPSGLLAPRSPSEGRVCPARAAPRWPPAQEHPPQAHSAARGSAATSATHGNSHSGRKPTAA